jgi:hypothetical protein
MRRFLWGISLGLAVATTAAASPQGDGDPSIIGGTATTLGQFPSVVVLEVPNGICTGTLITKDWVLTAAHCIDPKVLRVSNQAAVTAGTRVHFNTIDATRNPGTVVRAAETIKSASFSIDALGDNDIGLIRLASPVTDVAPSPVNLLNEMAPIGTIVTMVGYGATAISNQMPSGVGKAFFLENRVSISCASIDGSIKDANLLCYRQNDSKGKCEGDSGGPSFATINGVETVVGVTSFGDENCAMFGADTRTDAEMNFLLQHVPELRKACAVDDECDGAACLDGFCQVAPFTEGGLGSVCVSGDNCDSGQCGAGPGGMLCTTTCTPGMANNCPSGFECLDAGDTGACWPEEDDGGCCDTRGRSGPTALIAFGIVALAWRRRRR